MNRTKTEYPKQLSKATVQNRRKVRLDVSHKQGLLHTTGSVRIDKVSPPKNKKQKNRAIEKGYNTAQGGTGICKGVER
jgi:hypothetical protein